MAQAFLMIDNLNIILPLLKFDSEDDFYYLQILQRKKENPELGANSRVIKNYYITSIDHLSNRYEEIKSLCNQFNARASIRLNRRSFKSVAFKTLQNTANTMGNGDFQHISKCYDKACGQSHNEKEKSWIVDIDEKQSSYKDLIRFIDSLQPYSNKFIAQIPSLSGDHLITKPFNVQDFKTKYPNIDIHKDNPTNLYIP